jgi:hypothetical protein
MNNDLLMAQLRGSVGLLRPYDGGELMVIK